VLNYAKARRMADAIAPMGGREALEFVAQLLSVKLDVTGLERLPRNGAFLMLCNHPTGITDGVAVYDAIKGQRADVMFYANADAHRVCPRFDEVLIPVEWVLGKRTRERTRLTLKLTEQAFSQGKPIVVFPAGKLARRVNGELLDPEWMPTAVSLARKYELPIVPCHVAGPYAFWFHSFAAISGELRDITLFHELLNKRGRTYHLKIGWPIPGDALSADAVSATRRLKHYVERALRINPNAVFDPNGPQCAWRDPKPAAAKLNPA
jgi:putative hemolysin